VRGSSALQSLLAKFADKPLRAFVVWEPVMPTDIAPPTNAVLARLTDRRVTQVWDPERLLSQQLLRDHAVDIGAVGVGQVSDSLPVVWDVLALYPPGVRWQQAIPSPAWIAGPVADVMADAETHLRAWFMR
jgi:hypothetical protein